MRDTSRRSFVRGALAGGGAIVIGAAARPASAQVRPTGMRRGDAEHEAITPNEDLMIEHGLIGRVLVVWAAAEKRLRTDQPIDRDALRRSVDVVQRAIHDYHERTEEEHVFPLLERAGRETALVATLRAQHEAGRRVTRELASALAREFAPDARIAIADRLASWSRMYAAHAPREDTIVFPAFRELAGRDYQALAGRFEADEHARLGPDGLEPSLAEIAAIERALGVDDLAIFTPR